MKALRLLQLLLIIFVLVSVAFFAWTGKFPFMVQKDRWAISLYAGSSPLDLSPLPGLTHPLLTAEQVTDVSAEFVADPFLLRRQGRWYLFFEVLNSQRRLGEIGLAISSDGRNWQYQGIILTEEFHLSYPQIFEADDEIYMIPESAAASEVRLYRAVEFPWRWQPVATLIAGERLADPTVLQHAGRWWIFARGAQFSLRLFLAEQLDGPWREHPQSPLLQADPGGCRPGGRVIELDGRLLRLVQDGRPWYGSRVTAFEILELTPERYREKPVEGALLTGSGKGWNRDGMHHLDAHRLDGGGWLAAVDGFYKYWTLGRGWLQ